MAAGNATVVRLRPLGFDEYGNPIEGEPDELEIDGAIVAPRAEPELNDHGRHGVLLGLTLYVRASVDILHGDQFTVDGVLYDADAAANHWDSPYTAFSGTVVELVRAEG